MKNRRYHLTKWDVVLMAALAMTSVVLFAVVCRLPRSPGMYVEVSVSGTVTQQLPLAEDGIFVIQGIGGTNTLTIADGSARITDADCPDAVCVRAHGIKQTGEQIICLPHQVICEIVGDEPDLDVILP